MRALLVASLGMLVLAAAPAHADPYPQHGECDSAGQPALHRVEITGGSTATTVYVDDENWLLGNGIIVAEESNGIWTPKLPGIYLEGLSNENFQRGGSPPWVPGDNDICFDEPYPDQELF